MVAALSVPAFAYELKSFSDVAEDHWAYKAIMRSVELGLIAGTKAPDANGVGEFNPNANMTRVEMSRNVQSGNTQNLKSSAAPVRLPAAPAPTPGTSRVAVPAGCAYRS